MPDITDSKIKDRKLRFIEILLIVGGLIAGLRLKADDPMVLVFGFFLVMSMIYYFGVSSLPENTTSENQKSALKFTATLVALTFSAIATLPFILKITISPLCALLYTLAILVLWIVLAIFVARNLYY